MPQDVSKADKKTYRTPDLRDYGDIRDITLNATNQGANDNPTMKT